jgi:hypothetical protein
MIENFFKWLNKHNFFISGAVVISNIVTSIQSFKAQDYMWGSLGLAFALIIWAMYIYDVNNQEPKYKE